MTSSSCLNSLVISKRYTRNNTVRILVQNLQAVNTIEGSSIDKLFNLLRRASHLSGTNIQERDSNDNLLTISWEFEDGVSQAAWELLKIYFYKNHIPFTESLN